MFKRAAGNAKFLTSAIIKKDTSHSEKETENEENWKYLHKLNGYGLFLKPSLIILYEDRTFSLNKK